LLISYFIFSKINKKNLQDFVLLFCSLNNKLILHLKEAPKNIDE